MTLRYQCVVMRRYQVVVAWFGTLSAVDNNTLLVLSIRLLAVCCNVHYSLWWFATLSSVMNNKTAVLRHCWWLCTVESGTAFCTAFCTAGACHCMALRCMISVSEKFKKGMSLCECCLYLYCWFCSCSVWLQNRVSNTCQHKPVMPVWQWIFFFCCVLCLLQVACKVIMLCFCMATACQFMLIAVQLRMSIICCYMLVGVHDVYMCCSMP